VQWEWVAGVWSKEGHRVYEEVLMEAAGSSSTHASELTVKCVSTQGQRTCALEQVEVHV